jgi:hypothetical protein
LLENCGSSFVPDPSIAKSYPPDFEGYILLCHRQGAEPDLTENQYYLVLAERDAFLAAESSPETAAAYQEREKGKDVMTLICEGRAIWHVESMLSAELPDGRSDLIK